MFHELNYALSLLLVLVVSVSPLEMPSLPSSPHTSAYGSPTKTSPIHFHSDPPFLYPHEPVGGVGRQRLSSYYTNVSPPRRVKNARTSNQILSNIHSELVASGSPLDVKELYESFEFFLRTRKRLFGAAKKVSPLPLLTYLPNPHPSSPE